MEEHSGTFKHFTTITGTRNKNLVPVFNYKIILTKKFTNIYKVYYPMLYGMALQVSPTILVAEKILELSFKKIYEQHTYWHNKQPLCICLIKIFIETAKEELHAMEIKTDINISQFQKTPFLHKLILNRKTLEDYCIENNISKMQAMLNIKNEFISIRKENEKKYNNINITPVIKMYLLL